MGSIPITRSNPSQGLPATPKSARSRGRVEMLAQLACVGYRFTHSRSPVCNGVAYHPDPAGARMSADGQELPVNASEQFSETGRWLRPNPKSRLPPIEQGFAPRRRRNVESGRGGNACLNILVSDRRLEGGLATCVGVVAHRRCG